MTAMTAVTAVAAVAAVAVVVAVMGAVSNRSGCFNFAGVHGDAAVGTEAAWT